MQKVTRFTIPTDGETYEVEFAGEIIHVGCPANRVDTVEFWVLVTVGDEMLVHTLKAFTTLDSIPDDFMYVGTTVRVQSVVWHLFEQVEEEIGHITEAMTGLVEQ